MFNRLKALFATKKELAETIEQESLQSWILAKEKERNKEIQKQVQSIAISLAKRVKIAQDHVEKLEIAELRNDNIPKRAEQIMLGNKGAYIKNTRFFLDRIDTDIDEPEEFTAMFDSDLDNLSKSNQKSSQVLKEFFANETARVVSDIKDMDSTVKKIKDVVKGSGIQEMTEIKDSIERLLVQKQHLSKLKMNLERKKEQLLKLQKQQSDMMARLEELEKSQEYKEIKKNKNEKDSILSSRSKIDDELIQIFSVLNNGLKKYSRMAMNEQLIRKYLDNPLRAMLNDKGLEICEILKELKKNIDSGKIEMKDKKKQKTLEAIRRLSAEYINKFTDKRAELDEEKKQLEEQLRTNRAMHDFNEQDYLLNHNKQKVLSTKQEINQ